MRLTRSAELSLRAVLLLASRPGKRLQCREIGRALGVPESSLRGALNWLAAKGLLDSRSGHGGGFRLARPSKEINLRQVIQAVEGPVFASDCLVHGAPCGPEPGHWCPVHEVWRGAQEGFLRALEDYTAEGLAESLGRWQAVDRLLRTLAAGGPKGQRQEESR